MVAINRERLFSEEWAGQFLKRIGLLSDSHGRATTTNRAVDVLLDQGVDGLIHLGDIGTVEVIDALCAVIPNSREQVEAHLVFGNTDWDLTSLGDYAESLDVHVDHPAGRVMLENGKTLAFCHGHEPEIMQQALTDQVAYLCHGHTHKKIDTTQGSTRIINPGALFRASEYTVAVLDTETDQVRFFEVPGV